MSARSCQLNAGFRATLRQTARTPAQEPPAGREHAAAETLPQERPDLVSSSAAPGVTEVGHMDAVRRRGPAGWR